MNGIELRAIELRIGNLLIFFNGIEPEKIITVGRRFFSSASVEKEDGNFQVSGYYKPIPLTEEWLIKFGFKNNYRQYEWANWGMWVEKGLGDDYIVSHGFANAKSELKSIKYVHQLQNLYFEHSGEELPIKIS